MDYIGIIIEESLGLTGVLKDVRIIQTKVEPVTDLHQTPWLLQWTFLTIKVPFHKADQVALYLSHSFDSANPHWFADFKNDSTHYVIFPEKIFKIDRSNLMQYIQASNYGIAQGIPECQVNFIPEIDNLIRSN